MESPNSPKIILELNGRETHLFLAQLMTKPIIVLLTLFLATIVQMFRNGPSFHYWFLFTGSLVAGVLLLAFGFPILNTQKATRRGIIPMLLTIGGLVPYLFGCYLFFYEGFLLKISE